MTNDLYIFAVTANLLTQRMPHHHHNSNNRILYHHLSPANQLIDLLVRRLSSLPPPSPTLFNIDASGLAVCLLPNSSVLSVFISNINTWSRWTIVARLTILWRVFDVFLHSNLSVITYICLLIFLLRHLNKPDSGYHCQWSTGNLPDFKATWVRIVVTVWVMCFSLPHIHFDAVLSLFLWLDFLKLVLCFYFISIHESWIKILAFTTMTDNRSTSSRASGKWWLFENDAMTSLWLSAVVYNVIL